MITLKLSHDLELRSEILYYADKMVSDLHKYDENLIIHMYRAVTTNSVYLGLDFGLAQRIRFSDHKGNKNFFCRFSLRFDKKESCTWHKSTAFIYCVKDYDSLLHNVISAREQRIRDCGGIIGYTNRLRVACKRGLSHRGFWRESDQVSGTTLDELFEENAV